MKYKDLPKKAQLFYDCLVAAIKVTDEGDDYKNCCFAFLDLLVGEFVDEKEE